MEKHVSNLEKVVVLLQDHLDDQEDRGRRKNLRIIGLPEFSESSSALKFMEMWLPKVLALTTKDGNIKLERAQRVSGPTRRGADSRRLYPCTMILRFHHYSDRVWVPEAARWVKELRLLLSPPGGSTEFSFLSFFFSMILYHLLSADMDTNYS